MSGLEIMRIEDEFGRYVGTAVVDGMVLVTDRVYASDIRAQNAEARCRIVRVWTNYDETGAEMLAEGFIEGFGHVVEPPISLNTSVQSGSFVMGAEKEPE